LAGAASSCWACLKGLCGYPLQQQAVELQDRGLESSQWMWQLLLLLQQQQGM
jgi:hypothetical protein